MTRPLFKRSTVAWIAALLVVQLLCALFFLSEFLTEVLGLRHWALPWQMREILQLLASVGLLLGSVAAVLLLRHTLARIGAAERQVRAASGEFFAMMDGCFAEWGLSEAERDVALFAVRGCSNAEIAALRGTSEATVKTQMNAVFRKAGVSGRAQLVSLFVEVLIANEAPRAPRLAVDG